MRKSQWKPVPDPQEKKEQHQTSDGEQERPALTVGDLRKIFEPQKTNRPQRKNDDHGKTFEVRDQDGTGYKSHVLHSGVDQNRNVPNQEPQERSGEQGRPALTVGDLLKIYEVQDQNGTGYKSHVLHLGADQNRNVPNKDILGNKIDVPEEMHGNSLGKKENLSTIVDDLQKKIAKGEQDKDKLQEKIDDLQKKLGELQKNLDKGVHDQGDLRKKLEKYEQEKEELQHKLAHTLDRNEHLPATVDDICGKFDKYEEEKEELQHKFDDLQKKCEYTLGRREQLFSATVDNICEKLDKYEEEKEDLQHKFDDLQKKWAHNLDRMEKLSATVDDICGKLDKCEHDKEELQHKFGDLQKICVGNILEIREQLSATVGDIWGKFEEYQHKFEYSLSKKEQSSSILEELQHQFEELQHQFDDHMKECEYCLEEKKRLSANIDDLWKITEELQHQFERPQKIFDKKEQGKEDLPQTIEELQKKLDKYKQEKEELQKKSEDLQKEIDRRKAQFKLGWRESTLYPDWRKEEFQAVNVILDEATAHPSLLLTEEGRGVTLQEIQQDLPSSTQRFVSIPCVLGQPQICSGRYYWEVKVGELHSWDLGVCRDNVSRKGTFQMSPQNGFWAIRLYQEDYWALTISETHLTLREKPLSVGIFLDYEAGDVSFYNMTDESHIFTFSKQTFYGVLRPLFRLWFPDSGPLTIVEVE